MFIGHFALGFAAKRAVPHVSLAVLVTATFALVLSHWFLDFATHRPDMPLYPEGPKVGSDSGIRFQQRWRPSS